MGNSADRWRIGAPEYRNLDTVGLASVVAFGVTGAVSIWLSLVLADAVSGPIRDLRNATRRLSSGDLTVQVSVVSTDETGELAAAFNAMVVGLREREQLREAFGAFVDPALAERVLAEGVDLRGEEVEASILFLDVRGFTEFAERAPAQQVVACLNELYEAVVPVVVRHGGHANKFMGDGLLAVFGAPERHADHAARALAAACDVAQLVRAGVSGELGVGIGVNSGRVVVGTVGGGLRRDFTVIGDPVNTAARVEAATRLTGTTSLSPRLPCAPWVPLAMTSRSDDPCRLGAKPQRCACTPLGHTANLKCRAQNPPVITAGAQPLSKPGP